MTEPQNKTQTWSVGGQSVTGATHIHYNIPNQDAIAWSPREGEGEATVLALSDGHGASLHYRSGTGSHIAVETAVQVLTEALRDPAWIARADAGVGRQLVRDIVARWQSGVNDDIAARPLEKPTTSYGDRFLPYGATLIAVAVAAEGVFALQLGDGDLLLGRADAVVMRPLESDRGLQGEQTYSLCLPDAVERTRIAIFPASEAIDFAMLSTDGLSKSFANDNAFMRHAVSWRILLAGHGYTAIAAKLERWLVNATRFGNGDDVTLGFITRKLAAESSELKRFKLYPAGGLPRIPGSRTLAYGVTTAAAAVFAVAGFLLARWWG
ncbi:hypothetical protein GJW-30_1_04105 [Variibacter gotjawalensis]|uniref:PPM-type phosphatase domain-containing protein n=1 Tax=Variibacter gotjawalensis TaxID=1333996 RepID=A0A0S3Q022_9BRAD|nr:protein phosphatase 2C domain-containing protein [Variibacter gotjawalensis]NIK47386.1 serine/threonine protein phosphatase PrpC [Variibacter gotjawalensis]RZS49282.1 serine/threonine protein phosphatase PrpC [Variibacter gotjawalensis]BAT61546.1 hypothetical protein GJW-30_1_04105 [Variibacter gotjawalensis]